MKHTYNLKINNGRVKVYIDNILFFSFNQIDFKGTYAYKDDTSLYGLGIYLIDSESGGTTILKIFFKTKKVWLDILRLLDEHL